jgi:DNA primase
MNLLDLIANPLRKVATTNGGEFSGPCPWCGGQDRFRVWPEEGPAGRYWCRQCGKMGDAIQFLRDFKGLSFQEACQELKQNLTSVNGFKRQPGERNTWKPQETKRPDTLIADALWQQNVSNFLNGAERSIWSGSGKPTRAWLNNRGLNERSIKKARIGLNSCNKYVARESWGLSRKLNMETGNVTKLWLPDGLVIPFFLVDRIIRVRIRLRGPKGDMRYYLLPGSDTRPMVWGSDKKILCVVESELDGLLVQQEAGDIVGVVALGSAQVRPDPETHSLLTQNELILFSLDWDKAGRDQFQWWRRNYKNVIPWPTPTRKDPSDAFQDGLLIRSWILAGIKRSKITIPNNKADITQDKNCSHSSTQENFFKIQPISEAWRGLDEETIERLCIMTVDGGMTDSEAERRVSH